MKQEQKKMFRRNFIRRITLGGATGLAGISAAQARSHKTLTCHVKGFSCPTCAVGLDTMLRDQKGVIRSESTYPAGRVTIEFDPGAVTETALRSFIEEQGFRVENAATNN
jgi:Cu+-exporting ATPase